MSHAPFEQADSLRIGAVDFVSPDEIRVALDIEAPESIAMNAGAPRPFPRVNGYLLIPVDDAFLVGQIEWLTVERSAFPKRRGMQDFGLVDLPFPLRRLRLNPLGTLRWKAKGDAWDFRRGADSLPSIGASVLLPTDKQLRSIVESGDRRRVKIGTSPLASDAVVSVDPNRLFGRHLAVLGNTGSGKSCSVAGLIRWSIEQACDASGTTSQPNARFVVLDPNGEYSRAFSGDAAIKARIFKVDFGEGESALKVPLWLWNSAEWCAFAQASARTQRPTLIQALRSVRDGFSETVRAPSQETRRYLRTLVSAAVIDRDAGNPWKSNGPIKGFRNRLQKWNEGLVANSAFDNAESVALDELREHINSLLQKHTGDWPEAFTLPEVETLIGKLTQTHAAFGGVPAEIQDMDADVPRPFRGEQLLRSVEANSELLGVSDHVDTMLMRIRMILTDRRIQQIAGAEDSCLLDEWLSSYIGSDDAADGCVSVIDLSLVPTEVVHIVTAVIARMVFEASQRYLKLNAVALPTVLVMEEAHTFVRRYKEDVENQDAARICCQVFERIAREGRKFGLGLVLSSQRPSELSSTVLSQCNTFLLHRISNDSDQDLVQRLVPDNLRGLLRELPSLPSQHAILLGWTSELPVLVRMRDLPKSHQPRSDDPDFWGVWVGKDEEGNAVTRGTNWKSIADDWQALPATQESKSGENGV